MSRTEIEAHYFTEQNGNATCQCEIHGQMFRGIGVIGEGSWGFMCKNAWLRMLACVSLTYSIRLKFEEGFSLPSEHLFDIVE